jgi:hypothetical protein
MTNPSSAPNDTELAFIDRLDRMLVSGRGPGGRRLTTIQRAIVRELRLLIIDLARQRERVR